jgi:hypothetical protein
MNFKHRKSLIDTIQAYLTHVPIRHSNRNSQKVQDVNSAYRFSSCSIQSSADGRTTPMMLGIHREKKPKAEETFCIS